MPFPMQRQSQTLWCWAAVTASIDSFFSPRAARTQCDIASLVLAAAGCCRNPAPCNRAARLEDALGRIRRLNRAVGAPVGFSTIESEIRAVRPVCARVLWSGGSAHFVVISGASVSNRGTQLLRVEDPWYAPSNPIRYDDFRARYLGSGRWVATYFLTP
jgi:hypothetical protein